jgi:hypothetical protein
MIMKRAITTGAGFSIGVVLAAPAAAQADDIQVTNLNSSGAGSLRQALEDANDQTDADRILFKSKLSGTIDLAGDRLNIGGGDVEIVGPGARKVTVDGGGDSVFSAYTFYVSSLNATISGLTIAGAGANYGVGAFSYYGPTDLTLNRVTVTGTTDGPGVLALGDGAASTVIESSTISGNSNNAPGGGVYSREIDLSIRNSTISGNSAEFGGGALVYNDTSGLPNPAFEVLNSTVTQNEATNYGGGLAEYNGYDNEIRGSIIAGNNAPGAADLDDGPWATSFSIIGTDDNPTIEDGGGNLLNVDPKLKPLKDNGGPTDTHAFKKSPAKNKGPSDAPNSDQRGAPRKGKADIGAYEFTKCEGVVVNRVGTAGKDKLKGTKKKDGMLGLGGNDKLKGKKGKDGLCGGSGKDKLIGGPGKDKLNGGPGKDKEIQ